MRAHGPAPRPARVRSMALPQPRKKEQDGGQTFRSALSVVPTNPRGEPAYGDRTGSGMEPMWPSRRPGGRRRPGFSKEILRKEVIQPQVPLRLPCYDLVPITGFIFGACLAAPATSDAPRFGGLTGGVYKAQEHIHRGSADPRLLAIPASCGRVAARNPNWGAVFAIGAALRPGDALSAPL